MREENVEKLIAMLKEEAYIPGDRIGISEHKVINLNTVLSLINKLRD